MSLTPAQIIERLESIEKDASDRQAKGEEAAEDYHRAKRDFELAYAREYIAAEGQPTERKQRATLALAKSEAYFDLTAAEAVYEGWKAAMRTLELRTSIGQSLLKTQREKGA